MIFHISGVLTDVSEDWIIVEAHGVGYQIFVSHRLISELPVLRSAIKVITYHHIREDQQVLYGFSDQSERQVFMILTTVSGVGPKVGIKILSYFSSDQLIHAIVTENLAQLTQVPGVGKKVAERMIIELKDKLSQLGSELSHAELAPSRTRIAAAVDPDLSLALKTLGYSQDEIKRAFSQAGSALDSSLSLEESIKVLLKYL